MATPQEIMKALKTHSTIGGGCWGCPYRGMPFCIQRLCEDAYNLLAPQIPPRVLTPEEVARLGNQDIIWFDQPGYARAAACALHHDGVTAHEGAATAQLYDNVMVSVDMCQYGKTWRCWDRSPSPQQMEAQPW